MKVKKTLLEQAAFRRLFALFADISADNPFCTFALRV